MKAFVDLVGTLGAREWMPAGQIIVPRESWQTIWSLDRNQYAYWRLRSSAIPFLEALRARGLELSILSSSLEEETGLFLEEAGIYGWFSRIYGRDSKIPEIREPWVLIEDRDQEPYPEPHPGPHYKVLQIVGLHMPGQKIVEKEILSRALIAKHAIKSSTYEGAEVDIDPLTDRLTQIDTKLAAQASGE